jgi:hypothetical protein
MSGKKHGKTAIRYRMDKGWIRDGYRMSISTDGYSMARV